MVGEADQSSPKQTPNLTASIPDVLPSACLAVVLGILLTSGCATSRHCQQQELPGVRIHCCDTDLCNGSPQPPPSLAGGCLLLPSLLAALLLS